MTNLNNIMDSLHTEAQAGVNNARLIEGSAVADVDGVTLRIVITPVRTNGRTCNQRTWWVNGKRVAVAKVADAIAAARPEQVEEEEEVLPASFTQPDASFAAEYSWHRQTAELTKVAALRAVAHGWKWARKDFLAAAEKYGINRHTAATQWQAGRKA